MYVYITIPASINFLLVKNGSEYSWPQFVEIEELLQQNMLHPVQDGFMYVCMCAGT